MQAVFDFFSSLKSVWIGVTILFTLLAFAADARYLTYDAADVRDIKEIRREIADLEIEKRYAKDATERQKFQDKINQKEQQIKEIKGE